MLTMHRNGVCAVDERIVRCSDLTAQLRIARERHPTLQLELNGDRRLPSSSIFQALAAARDAGYTEAIVFGRGHSLLEIASRE